MNNPPDIQNTHVDFSCSAAEAVVIAEIISGTPHRKKLFEQLQPEDFSIKKYSKLFDNLRKSAEAGTIEDYSIRLIEAGHMPDPSREMRVWDAAGTIMQNASKRSLLTFLVDSHQDLMDPTQNVSALQQSIKAALVEATDPRTSDLPEEFHNSVEAARKSMDATGAVMSTGLRDIDRQVQIMSDSLVIIAARPSQGKTALALSIIVANLQMGNRPAFCSMEMNDTTIIKRLVSMLSGVEFSRINRGWNNLKEDEARLVRAAWDQVMSFPVDKHWLNCSGRATVNQVSEWMDIVRPDFAVLDYGQLMEPTKKRQSRREELGDITGDLRQLANDSRTPIFLLAQLNRGADEDHQPKMKHIKDSATFEQDATDVILIDRPESGSNPTPVSRNYRTPSREELILVSEDGSTTGNAALLIDKQRNGACGYCAVKFDGPTMCFSDYLRNEEAPKW